MQYFRVNQNTQDETIILLGNRPFAQSTIHSYGPRIGNVCSTRRKNKALYPSAKMNNPAAHSALGSAEDCYRIESEAGTRTNRYRSTLMPPYKCRIIST